MSVQEKKETLHAAKPRFHVTGVSFDGYQVKQDGEQAADPIEDGSTWPGKEHEPRRMASSSIQQENGHKLRYVASGGTWQKNSVEMPCPPDIAIRQENRMEQQKAVREEGTEAYRYIFQTETVAAVHPRAETDSRFFHGQDMKGKVYPKQAQIWGQEKKLPEPVQTWEETEPVQEETTQEEKQQRVWDVWSAVIHAVDRKKSETHKRMDRETLIRKCNVRTAEAPKSVAGKQELAEHSVLESDEEEPWVCSEEQREAIKKKKADKEGKKQTSDFGEDREADEGKRKRRTDRTKRRMLREYVIHELVHEEEKRDPNAHIKLIGRMLKYDINKLVAAAGKQMFRFFGKLFLLFLPVLIIAGIILLPLAGYILYLTNPVSYYGELYDLDENLKEDPDYLKNVIQEKYQEFSGQIQTFLDYNELNDVVYAYENYSDADDVAAAYLAQLMTLPEYSSMTWEESGGYPPYLLVDSAVEKNLLNQVFSEFNYVSREEITLKVKGEDGKERTVKAEKMTVYCLTLEQWKESHPQLSEEAGEILALLSSQAEKNSGTQGGSFGDAEAVPIEDLVIPEGVDENLIYMAGFIKAEAGNQSDTGKIAVAYVILNRAGGASGNIKGVLTAPYQFSCYIPYHTVEKYLTEYAAMTQEQREADACYRAAAGAYYGTASNPIGEMKYYCNPKYCSAGETAQWRKIRAKNTEDEIIVIGDHVFCRNCW